MAGLRLKCGSVGALRARESDKKGGIYFSVQRVT
jgi:hypothetical protein